MTPLCSLIRIAVSLFKPTPLDGYIDSQVAFQHYKPLVAPIPIHTSLCICPSMRA